MFQIHRSNRTERLLDVIAGLVAEPCGDPFVEEVIVVQSRGMERWLSMQLATRLGVWGRSRFPFPRAFIDEVFSAVVGAPPADAKPAFEREHLLWAIARALPRLLERPTFAPLRAWLHGDADAGRRIELAGRIAQTFDQYAVYRPEMVLAWEDGPSAAPPGAARGDHAGNASGDEPDWQPELWREVAGGRLGKHAASYDRDFGRALSRLRARPEALPARVCFFGVTTLPPLYLRVLARLGRLMDVHFVLLSPTKEWVGDLPTRRERRRATLAGLATGHLDPTALADDEHPLLASLGGPARDLLGLLYGDPIGQLLEENDRELFVDPGDATLLHTLQSDLLHLRRRGGPATELSSTELLGASVGAVQREPVRVVPASDDSIRVHACHAPIREVEVLRDQLLALLDGDRTLRPRDIVVMTPDIERYAPLIDAVFGVEREGEARLPYRIADRVVRATSPAVESFLASLSLVGGRMKASEVLDLLWTDPVRRRFGFSVEDLPRLRDWVQRSGIRWAIDGADRARLDQPEFEENTWRFGLRRLLLGMAAGDDERALFGGVAPFGGVEGGDAEVLGRFAAYVEVLTEAHARLVTPRPVTEWARELAWLVDALVDDEEQEGAGATQVRAALAGLREGAEGAGFTEPLALDAVRRLLVERLGDTRAEHAFLSGGISFCALLPMRSIPFRVVALLGLNDGEFPRTARGAGFDLIAAAPRPGDRVLRDEDRYLFLEALLSARDRLIVTYVGQSVRDNKDRPPSGVLSELLDTIEEGFALAGPPDADDATTDKHTDRDGGQRLRAHLVMRHPLQAFSSRYFDRSGDPRFFSYASELVPGARAAAGERHAPRPFVIGPLPVDPDEQDIIGLDDLARFFERPASALVRRRLGLRLEELDALQADREPIALSPLDAHDVGSLLVEWRIAGAAGPEALEALRARGSLPLGTPGRQTFDELWPQACRIAEAALPWIAGHPQPLAVDQTLGAVRLVGSITDVWPRARVRYGYARLKARTWVRNWVRHLALQAASPTDGPRETRLFGRPALGAGVRVERFRPVENASVLLGELVNLYLLGQQAPLPLFADASLAYVERFAKERRQGRDEATARGEALRAAGTVFRGYLVPGEKDHPAVKQLFDGGDPLASGPRLSGRDPPDGEEFALEVPDFETVSRAVFEPLLAHLEAVDDGHDQDGGT